MHPSSILCHVVHFIQRELNESKRDALTKEFNNLNLTQYIQEAVSHVVVM